MTNPIYYKRLTGSTIQGNADNVIEPIGTIVVTNGGDLRYHDGSTAGGSALGGGDHMTVRNSTLQLDGAGVAWIGSYGAGDYNYGGFYSTDSLNTLFTFSSDGTPNMSVQLDGALFVGSSAPPNAAGVNITNPGWIVASGGGKFGGDINTAGGMGITSGITWSTSGSQIFEDSSLIMSSPSADVVLVAGEAYLTLLPSGVLQVPPILQGGGGDPNVYIEVSSGGGWKTWTFDSSGTLELPASGNITTPTGLSIYSTGQTPGGMELGSGNASFYVYNGVASIITNNQNGQAKSWTWDANGKITLPAGGDIVDSSGETVLGFAASYYSGYTVLSSDAGGITVTGDVTSVFSANQIIKFSTLTEDEYTVDTVTYDSGNNWTSITLVEGLGGPVDDDNIFFEKYNISEIYPGEGIQSTLMNNVLTLSALPQRLINNGHQLVFDTTGNLTFPDGGSLRVGQVPAHSTGAAGDKIGTVAFDSTYIYYCTDDFGGTTYTVQTVVPATGNPDGYLVADSSQAPSVGWKVYYNNQTVTINDVQVGMPGFYTIFTDVALSVPAYTNFQYGPAPSTNIWKRVDWSADTW